MRELLFYAQETKSLLEGWRESFFVCLVKASRPAMRLTIKFIAFR